MIDQKYEVKGSLTLASRLTQSPEEMVNSARSDAINRSSGRSDAAERITRAISTRVLPYIRESWTISDKLESPAYVNFVRETGAFLNTSVGFVVCPDGRIAVLALGDPLLTHFYRRLQGLPQTRESTTNGHEPVIDDPYLSAPIGTGIKRRLAEGRNPELTEFIGCHIHSLHPDHGCGACIGAMRSEGRFTKLAMKYGGVPEYFDILSNHFKAFENNAARAGGKGTSIDFVHDAYSEGGIIGLREMCQQFEVNFDTSLSLRQNLLKFHDSGKIWMTERTDDEIYERVQQKSAQRGFPGSIDVTDPERIDQNAILIGTIAREITEEEKKKNYPFIAETIKKDKSEVALDALAYHGIRNGVYRIKGGIRPGQHPLEVHPERLTTVGPTSAILNRRNIAFVLKTFPMLTEKDVENALTLHNLAADVMSSQEIDLIQEARVILATGEFDPSIYRDKIVAEEQYDLVESIVSQNAAKLRQRMKISVSNGETVVIGAIHTPKTRKIISLV